MIQLIVILFCVASGIVAFFSVTLGWIILWIPTAFLLIRLFGVKQKKWQYIPELSETANQMLQKFGNYYAMPFAGRDFSACANTLMFAGAAVAIIGVFKGFWWGIAIGIVNWFVMGMVSRAFNPANFLVDPTEKMAHKEIISYITARQKSGVDDTERLSKPRHS